MEGGGRGGGRRKLRRRVGQKTFNILSNILAVTDPQGFLSLSDLLQCSTPATEFVFVPVVFFVPFICLVYGHTYICHLCLHVCVLDVGGWERAEHNRA